MSRYYGHHPANKAVGIKGLYGIIYVNMLINTGRCSWDIWKVYINKYHAYQGSYLPYVGIVIPPLI